MPPPPFLEMGLSVRCCILRRFLFFYFFIFGSFLVHTFWVNFLFSPGLMAGGGHGSCSTILMRLTARRKLVRWLLVAGLPGCVYSGLWVDEASV
ncbi:hypothetical protein BU16DRAFT_303011 [Lophium mytilinum]|uniref:Uncharacterized protein n=1 Tax=Lophium mytilinum TaxID=390894 RepID=A0A6A6R339_9PEZI|nr:hypothetical protein BU16DRAFT_303011 [Lophium mytilinum]